MGCRVWGLGFESEVLRSPTEFPRKALVGIVQETSRYQSHANQKGHEETEAPVSSGTFNSYIEIMEKDKGNYYVILGLNWDNGKENGNYFIILGYP